MARRVTINYLWPLNLASVIFGGKWALSIIHVNPTWGEYLLYLLVMVLVYIGASAKWTVTRWR